MALGVGRARVGVFVRSVCALALRVCICEMVRPAYFLKMCVGYYGQYSTVGTCN